MDREEIMNKDEQKEDLGRKIVELEAEGYRCIRVIEQARGRLAQLGEQITSLYNTLKLKENDGGNEKPIMSGPGRIKSEDGKAST